MSGKSGLKSCSVMVWQQIENQMLQSRGGGGSRGLEPGVQQLDFPGVKPFPDGIFHQWGGGGVSNLISYDAHQ